MSEKNEPNDFGRKRQSSIYITGLSGTKPSVPIDMNALEAKAAQVMTPEAFAYIAGGAGMERTMALVGSATVADLGPELVRLRG